MINEIVEKVRSIVKPKTDKSGSSALKDEQLVKLISNRWDSGTSLWGIIENCYKKNKALWENKPEGDENIPKNKSNTKDNRIFLATESVINALTGKPSKPNVVLGSGDPEEGKKISADLQDYILEQYKQLKIKKKMRQAIRNTLFSRLFVIKVLWDNVLDDFNLVNVLPNNVRFSKNAVDIDSSEFGIEKITKPVLEVIALFPDKKKKILDKLGIDEEKALIENPDMTYYEAWLDYGKYMAVKYEDVILKRQSNPYFKEDKGYFQKSRAPYIFGSVLQSEDKPIGETSLIEQVESLQMGINRRKQQFDNNAELMNGIVKIDTNIVTGISKTDAQKMKNEGIWYGAGVSTGITRETGRELPSFLQNDLIHSIGDLDNIFGTGNTFRGERGGQNETATGRGILREQSYIRLDEWIDLIDGIHLEIYKWMAHFIKTRYTEEHLVNFIGEDKAVRVIKMLRENIKDGLEIKIVPGQILPEDKEFKSDKMLEALQNKIISPLDYFEAGGFDNPQRLAKNIEMYKINPLSILDMTPEDLQKLQQGNQTLGVIPGTQQNAQKKAQIMGETRMRVQKMMQSPEFQAMSLEEKQQAIAQAEQTVEEVARTIQE